MNYKYFILVFIGLWGLISCEKDEVITIKIDSDIIIEMFENLDSLNRTFEIHCKTEKNYSPYHAHIITNWSKINSKITIEFEGVLPCEYSCKGSGPAIWDIDFGFLETDIYELKISIENDTNDGLLIITDTSFQIIFDSLKRLQIINSTKLRVPENTIWGTVGYFDSSSNSLAQQYLDSLLTLGAIKKSYTSGNYGYFKIDNSGDIKPLSYNNEPFQEPYIFYYADDMDKIENLVKYYSSYAVSNGADYDDAVYIILYNSEMSVYRSWTY